VLTAQRMHLRTTAVHPMKSSGSQGGVKVQLQPGRGDDVEVHHSVLEHLIYNA
jgi:hypothetical protein